MLISKSVVRKWNSKNKQHYQSLGYQFSKIGDEFDVAVYDLPDGSNAIVEVECDYCNKNYTKPWNRYLSENCKSTIHNDCYTNCKKYKIQDSAMQKYGVKSVLLLDEVKERIANTNISIYGCTNPFSSESVKNKIAETNISKFGVTHPMKSKTIQSKARNTCVVKYGVPYYVMKYNGCGKDSKRWKGGVLHRRQERSSHEYITWRNDVFIRDRYTCQCCGDKSGNGHTVRLNAHHVMNWKDNVSLRYDVDNGITLCSSCHTRFHSEYGKQYTTQEQLNSFLINHGKKIC